MLIDTSALIWYGLEPNLLSKRATRLMGGGGNFYSHVSLWEMAIKSGLGKLKLRTAAGRPASARSFLLTIIHDLDLSALPIEFDDLAAVEILPLHHKDPFDRLLVAQAKRYGLPVISADPIFEQYGLERAW